MTELLPYMEEGARKESTDAPGGVESSVRRRRIGDRKKEIGTNLAGTIISRLFKNKEEAWHCVCQGEECNFQSMSKQQS